MWPYKNVKRKKIYFTRAFSRTSSIFFTGIILRFFKIFFSTFSKSPTFSFGIITFVMPDLFAAISFSYKPPIFKTLPPSVISPVIAKFPFTFLFRTTDDIAVHIVIPALGPSLGVAPSGT